MSDSNRTQVAYVEEVTYGVAPVIAGTTVMRQARLTGESLNFNISNVVSNEIRSDRMVPDLVQSGQQNGGGINYELSWPLHRSFLGDMMGGVMFNNWVMQAYKNNIVADSELANVAAGTGVYTVDAGGATFITGSIVQASGFTAPLNNGVFDVTANGATTVTTTNAASVAEAAPPVGATLRTVGFHFASGDLVATSSGLTCTAANFLTMGLAVGKWIKLGGTGAGNRFATAADNAFVRVIAVTANAVTLDNLPTGWAADTGVGVAVKMWFGDTIKNGTTVRSFTLEKGFLDVAQYFTFNGMIVGSMSMALAAQQIATGDFSFLGTSAARSGVPLSATPYGPGTEDVMSAMANVARIAEANVPLGPNNFAQSFSFAINNNLRPQQAIGQLPLIGVGVGRCDVTGNITCYFKDGTQLDKYLAGTPSAINFRSITAGGRALVATIPNMEFETGQVVAAGPNQDVMSQFSWRAKLDALTNSEISFDRFPYYEA